MKNIIIVQNDCTFETRAFTSLKKVCEVYDLTYHTMKSKKFPISFMNYTIRKMEIER